MIIEIGKTEEFILAQITRIARITVERAGGYPPPPSSSSPGGQKDVNVFLSEPKNLIVLVWFYSALGG